MNSRNRMIRVNIGCGQSPIKGWQNFDNSISLRLSKVPLLAKILNSLGILKAAQNQFIKFARENKIKYGDATKGLPLIQKSCEVIYSSHMLEHLDRNEADKFLKEAYRLLCPSGTIRIAVPDIKKLIAQYDISGDADAFIEATLMCIPRPIPLPQKIKLLVVGTRHHQWMYDGNSLSRLLQRHGFVETQIVPAGETTIPDPGSIDLHEQSSQSVYVEAKKPVT